MKNTKTKLISSVTVLLICFAMLIGSTFAWFTDSASTGVNKIQAGNLDIALEMSTDGTTWESAEGKTLTFKTQGNRAADQILWEPGCTYELPMLRVVNNGNLALKYKIQINGIQGDAKLNEVIDWTINGAAIDHQTEVQLPVGQPGTAFTIKGHMQDTAGNEYKNLTIDGIGITVVATQDTKEHDSFNNTYDENADYTIHVNRDNIQDYLDGKYGSINGMTLVLAQGNYDKIEFGRATEYEGSNTKYYLGGTESTVAAIKQDIADHPNGGARARKYVRYMNNVTLKAADNATVTINGLVAFGGQVNSTNWYSRDFVADRDMSATVNNNISYSIGQKWSNITFEGLTFKDGVNIEAYGNEDTLIDNVKFENCKFDVIDTDTNKTNCIRLNVDGNIAKANNLVVKKCEFTDGYTAVLTDGMPNVTVMDSTFSGLTKHAISQMMNYLPAAPGYGKITVSGNTFKNMSSDISGTILRMGKVDKGTVFVIKNNTATEGITLENSIKVNSLADSGITYDITRNNWGSLTASDSRLYDK